MSRKLILSLAAIGALASASFVTGSAEAMVAHGTGGHGGNGHRPPIYRPHQHVHHHAHWRYTWRHGYYRPVGYVARVAEPGPCTCLWKGYTPEGNVVFKDMCTQEMASAPVEGAPAQASEVQAPGNFAGKSYKDYLAANPQSAPTEPQKN
jgi:hypothetical protein